MALVGHGRNGSRWGEALRSSSLGAALLFLAPALIAVVVLRIWPAGLALWQSLHEPGAAPGFANMGFGNYTYLLSDPVFIESLTTTFLFLIIVNPVQIGLALLLALAMDKALPAGGLWRTLMLLPVAVPQSVSAIILGVAFRPDGPVNALLATIGIPPQGFMTSTSQALMTIIMIVSWVGVGYWMTFLLAGLRDIPHILYEAAEIDGANSWQRFWHVTLPQLRRTLTFVLVANTVANFLVFAPVQILTKGGPQGSTNLIMNEIYTRGFLSGDMSGAAAATVILVALVIVVVGIQFRMMTERAKS
ncbi:Carbohydrate ABC transporter membrane protein 1 (CUT1 family) [Hyphomicrobiales bacterium]|nr:Carbohydrate ABC transporter membrane protein 1 (CUT1 family) [Hyphomicrobiales bacterium]CAH1695068.1 Carbohydrate ABC transporter membrane protein 1, CUT1 family [Hyphomicrobiales bacterium]